MIAGISIGRGDDEFRLAGSSYLRPRVMLVGGIHVGLHDRRSCTARRNVVLA
jgi:hypothetical protein